MELVEQVGCEILSMNMQSSCVVLLGHPALLATADEAARSACSPAERAEQQGMDGHTHVHTLPPRPTLLQVKEQNLAEAIGVSNFNAKRLKAAAKRLQQAGINLASNQVGRHECRQAKAECNKLTKRCLGGLFFC